MEIKLFKKILSELKKNLSFNKNYIDKALYEDFSKKMPVNFKKIFSYIDRYEAQNIFPEENKNVAYMYNGLPEVTIELILDSIVHNNRTTFFITSHKELNRLIIESAIEAILNCHIQNTWLDFEIDYNEIYLKDNASLYQEISFIGDYFEHEKIEQMIGKKVKYYNYGNIKLYIHMREYEEELKTINDYCYKNAIALETFDDIEDFINSVKEEDYGIIYADINVINQMNRLTRADEIKFNSFPYDDYKFEVRR